MPDTVGQSNKTSVRSQIMALVDRMPADMQLKLLTFLESRLPRRIKGRLVVEKRADFRRDCLISVDYTVQGDTYKSFILDISAFGVFIESDAALAVGSEIRMSFALPNQPTPFNLRGQIVWSGSHGFGVRFNPLTPTQNSAIRSFAEGESPVYTIVS
jgi:Tfp pilus assembly protein PilZ